MDDSKVADCGSLNMLKIAALLATALSLGACVDPPGDTATPGPVAISGVNVEMNNVDGMVSVWLTVENPHDMALSDLSIHLVPRDEDGQLIKTAHLELQAARPIRAGETVGPIRVSAVTQGHQVSCVELYHVRAVLPDNSIHFVSGPGTADLVAGEPDGLCRATGGEQAAISRNGNLSSQPGV